MHWSDPEDEWQPLCGESDGPTLIVERGTGYVSGLNVYTVCDRCRETDEADGNDEHH